MKNLKIKRKFSVDVLQEEGAYSFMNLASLTAYFREGYQHDLYYFCDGFLMSSLVRILTGEVVERVSFDFTSIAENVFSYAEKKGASISFVGANQVELDFFIEKIKCKYPELIIELAINGFYNRKEELDIIKNLASSSSSYVVVGLGAGKQEHFMLGLKKEGFKGTIFSCGGFIRQESGSSGNYYPRFINDLGLRAFYRMYKEPHTIKRYAFDYPKNVFCLISNVILKKMKIKLS